MKIMVRDRPEETTSVKLRTGVRKIRSRRRREEN